MVSVKLMSLALPLLMSVSFVTSAPRRSYSGKRVRDVPDDQLLEAIYNDTVNVENGGRHADPDGSTRMCYDELGCFDSQNGVFSYIGELPWSPQKINMKFTLFTSANKDSGVAFTYSDVSPAIPLLETSGTLMFIIHGFSSDGSAQWMMDLKNIALDTDRAAILVDWADGCPFPYYAQSVVNMELVGHEVAVVLWKLMQALPNSIAPSVVHYVGHSLGGQAGRFFADYFDALSGGLRIGRITALDPAGPLLENHHVYVNSSSANYVDVLHTSAGDDTAGILLGHLGMHSAVGHLDIFANGGTDQPGCPLLEFLTCPHGRAHDYYVSAARLADPRKRFINTCTFQSYACQGGKAEYDKHECRRVSGQWNAISLDNSYSLPGRGTEFVDTTGQSPFCEGAKS